MCAVPEKVGNAINYYKISIVSLNKIRGRDALK